MAKLHQSLHFDKDADANSGGGVVVVTDSDTGESLELPLEPKTHSLANAVLPTEMPMIPEDINMLDMGDAYGAFFSAFLGRECRLAYRDPNRVSHGPQPDRWDMKWREFLWRRKAVTSCTDNAPLHFVTEESLAKLSAEMGDFVAAERFRANFIVRGADEPWDEETWKLIGVEGVGRISVTVGNQGVRCPMSTRPKGGSIESVSRLFGLRKTIGRTRV